LDDVRGVLDMWYPGQEGGPATADLLLGTAVPAGKLPVTFPVREADAPTATSPERYPGVNGQEFYSEGILTGYRWYDAMGSLRCSRSASGCRTRRSAIRAWRCRPPGAGRRRCGSPSPTPGGAPAPRWPRCTSARCRPAWRRRRNNWPASPG